MQKLAFAQNYGQISAYGLSTSVWSNTNVTHPVILHLDIWQKNKKSSLENLTLEGHKGYSNGQK